MKLFFVGNGFLCQIFFTTTIFLFTHSNKATNTTSRLSNIKNNDIEKQYCEGNLQKIHTKVNKCANPIWIEIKNVTHIEFNEFANMTYYKNTFNLCLETCIAVKSNDCNAVEINTKDKSCKLSHTTENDGYANYLQKKENVDLLILHCCPAEKFIGGKTFIWIIFGGIFLLYILFLLVYYLIYKRNAISREKFERKTNKRIQSKTKRKKNGNETESTNDDEDNTISDAFFY